MTTTLTVNLIRAQNLPRTDEGGRGKIDPFFIVRLGNQSYQTSKRQNDLNPNYNETFTFVDPPGRDLIQFELYDDEGPGRKAEYVGNVAVNSDKLPNGVTWLNLMNRQNRNVGQVQVEIIHARPMVVQRSIPPPAVVVQRNPPPTVVVQQQGSQKTLSVRILRGQNLPRTDEGGRGKIDPYFVVRFANQKYQTTARKNDLNPSYNESFTFVDPPGRDTIHFELFDDDPGRRSEYVANASVDTDRIPSGIVWLNLTDRRGRSEGQLQVEIIHTRAAAQPAVVVVTKPGGFPGPSGGFGAPPQRPPVPVVVVQQKALPQRKALSVRIIRAQNLPRTDDGGRGKIDPFFIVRFAGQSYQTTMRQDDLNPNYNESFTFADPPGRDIINFELYDDEGRGRKAEFIATASVPSDKLPNGITWLNLTDKRGRSAGQVQVEIVHI